MNDKLIKLSSILLKHGKVVERFNLMNGNTARIIKYKNKEYWHEMERDKVIKITPYVKKGMKGDKL